MTRLIRILTAAASIAVLSLNMAQTQAAPASITFNDPNCASWAMSGTAPNFTLTCQSLNCSIVATPANPAPGQTVSLAANCTGATGSAAYSWTNVTGGACLPVFPSGNPAIVAASATISGCVYRVAATDAVTGNGQAFTTLNWSSGPPPNPSGCSASIVTNPTTLTNAGGTATVSVVGCSPGGVTYNWSKNGSPGWSTSASPPADTLPAGGSSGYTNSYQVQVCNGSSCINVPSGPLTAVVPGSGGGGGSLDLSACNALGYSDARWVDADYPSGSNININYMFSTAQNAAGAKNGIFLNQSALVVRFTTPALGVNDVTSPNFQAEVGSNGARQATIGTQPCLVPTFNQTTLPVAKTLISQTPAFNVVVVPGGVCNVSSWLCSGTTWLAPSTTYYMTLVNKGTFTGPANTCQSANCDMRWNFNN